MSDEPLRATLMLPTSLVERLDALAIREDRSRSAVARRLMNAALEAEARARADQASKWRGTGECQREAA